MKASKREREGTLRPLHPAQRILLLLALNIFVWWVFQWRGIPSLPYPPGADQDTYLAAARLFSDTGLLDPKAPLYSIWLGMAYWLGGSGQNAFIIEKAATSLLLVLGSGTIGFLIAGMPGSLLLSVWMANLKYVGLEVNGSNSFATVFVIAAIISILRAPVRWKRPSAALLLFLASQVRPEFTPILAAYLVIVAGRGYVKNREGGYSSLRNFRLWFGLLVAITIATVTIRSRLSEPRFTSSIAVYASFCVTWVERHNLDEKYDQPWLRLADIWDEAYPEIPQPMRMSGSALLFEMADANMNELVAHLWYNTLRTPKPAAAVAIGFVSHLAMLLAFATFIFWQWQRLKAREMAVRLALPTGVFELFLPCLALLPIAIVMIPMWRYYIPLTPFAMVMGVWTMTFIIGRLRNETKMESAE